MSTPGKGDRVSVYHDPITMNEIEAVDAMIVSDEGHVAFVEGREMRRYSVRIFGLGVVERNVLLPNDDSAASLSTATVETVEPEPSPSPMTLARWKKIRAEKEKAAAARRCRPTIAAGVDLLLALAWMRRLPCLRHVGKVKLVVAHSAYRHSRGTAYLRQRQVRLRIGSEATAAYTLELLLHELVHLALPPKTHHGESFRRLLRVAAREAWGIDVSIDQAPMMGVVAYGMDDVIRRALDGLLVLDPSRVDTFPPTPSPTDTTPAPSRAERLAEVVERRARHAEKMLARAERRSKLAQKALIKWRQKARYYERVAAKRATGGGA